MTGSFTTVSTHDWPLASPSSATIVDRSFVMATPSSMQQRHAQQVGPLEPPRPERVEQRFAIALGAIAALDWVCARGRGAGIVRAITDALGIVHLRHRVRLDVVRVGEPEALEQ